jgi:hypothetical protein
MKPWVRATPAFVLTLLLAGWASPALGLAADITPNAGEPCAEAGAILTPHHLHVGKYLSGGGNVENCSNHPEGLLFRASLTGACGFSHREATRIRLRAGDVYGVSIPTFKTKCRGTYRIAVKVLRHGVLLDRATDRAHVT